MLNGKEAAFHCVPAQAYMEPMNQVEAKAQRSHLLITFTQHSLSLNLNNQCLIRAIRHFCAQG